MGTKVLDTATEGDGTVFTPAGNFNTQVVGSLSNGSGASVGSVQLLCSQDGGTTYDVVEEFNKPNDRHRVIVNCGTASYKFRLVLGNLVLSTPVKAYWNQ